MSCINYRTFSSGIAKNKLDISRATCARIVGDGNQQNTEYTEYTEFDLSDNHWPDQTPMNDSISSYMLKSNNNTLCSEEFTD